MLCGRDGAMVRRGLGRVGRIACVVVLVVGVGGVGCVELAYRTVLHGIPTTPEVPSTQVVAPLERTLWGYLDGTSTPEMRPIYPWRVALWIGRAIVGEPSVLPGFNIAGTVASMHLQSLGRSSRELTAHFRGFSLIIWVSRHLSASQAVSYWATRVRGPRGSSGLYEASRLLFGESPDRIRMSQLALLLAVSWNPDRNDPWCHPERISELRTRALDQLVRAGVLSETDRSTAERERLALLERECSQVR